MQGHTTACPPPDQVQLVVRVRLVAAVAVAVNRCCQCSPSPPEPGYLVVPRVGAGDYLERTAGVGHRSGFRSRWG